MGLILSSIRNGVHSLRRYNAAVKEMKQNIKQVRMCTKNIASIVNDLKLISNEVKETVSESSEELQKKLCEEISTGLSEEDFEDLHNLVFYEEFVAGIEEMRKIDGGILNGDLFVFLLGNLKLDVIEAQAKSGRKNGEAKLLTALAEYLGDCLRNDVDFDSSFEDKTLLHEASNEVPLSETDEKHETGDMKLNNSCRETKNFAKEREEAAMLEDKDITGVENIATRGDLNLISNALTRRYDQDNQHEWLEMESLDKNTNASKNFRNSAEEKKKQSNNLRKLCLWRKKKLNKVQKRNINSTKFCELLKSEFDLRTKLSDHLVARKINVILPCNILYLKRVLEGKPEFVIEKQKYTPVMSKVNFVLESIFKHKDFTKLNLRDLKIRIDPDIDFKEALGMVEQAASKMHEVREDVVDDIGHARTALHTDIKSINLDNDLRCTNVSTVCEIVPFKQTFSLLKETSAKKVTALNLQQVVDKLEIGNSFQVRSVINFEEMTVDERALKLAILAAIRHGKFSEKSTSLKGLCEVIESGLSMLDKKSQYEQKLDSLKTIILTRPEDTLKAILQTCSDWEPIGKIILPTTVIKQKMEQITTLQHATLNKQALDKLLKENHLPATMLTAVLDELLNVDSKALYDSLARFMLTDDSTKGDYLAFGGQLLLSRGVPRHYVKLLANMLKDHKERADDNSLQAFLVKNLLIRALT
eukprot:Seg80.4 transcript_id=Seg80.4/GoldUCD/mRNA.D3Y31 product="hypothetical protein" protein_id=Seg80.4/GoldUCD/D3Y31